MTLSQMIIKKKIHLGPQFQSITLARSKKLNAFLPKWDNCQSLIYGLMCILLFVIVRNQWCLK